MASTEQHRWLWVGLLAGLCAAGPASAADLALKRVMLSSAGVGYFEYSAEVDGPATLGLDVPLAQVDDVLKSLVVFDDAGGVGGIELPGHDQTHSAFGQVPFGPEGLESPLAYLNSLQGVEITVEGPTPMHGRLIHAEMTQEAAARPGLGGTGVTLTRTRVSVLTEDGLKQFVLEDSEAVQVADPALRARIAQALAALKRESGQDSRHLTIRTAGAGHRVIRVGYVAVAPLWKASYRMVLPPVGADTAHSTARLQGWATLENDSGTDWAGVSLTLQYGNPVTFHQAIYRSYFVDRPEVPVEVLGRLLPDVDQRVIGRKAMPSMHVYEGPTDREYRFGREQLPSPANAPAAPRFMPPPEMDAQSAEPAVAGASNTVAPPAEPVVAAEDAEETVFTLPTPVSLAAGHSASVPILDHKLPAARIDVAQGDEAHPRAAIRVHNDTEQSLPAGVLTLYDEGDAPYVGDARLGGLPAGEDRLLQYAQDLRTGLQWQHRPERALMSLKAAAGSLQIRHRDRAVTEVTVVAPVKEPRQVLLTLQKDYGRKLADGFTKPSEETATEWRFAVDLKAGETRKLTLATDTDDVDTVAVDEASDTLAALNDTESASDAIRAALAHVADLRRQESARQDALHQLTGEQKRLESEEARVRQNLVATFASSALHERLTRQLDADETRLGTLADAIDSATADLAAAHKTLTAAINALDF
jgi:hypothetical protein